MAAMARVLGLPARVGVGFVPGSALGDGSRQITTSDAHAWPEVWFAGHGWVRFEPTPRSDAVITPDYSVPQAEGRQPTTPDAPDPQAAPPVDPADPGALDDNVRQLDESGALPGDDGSGTSASGVGRSGSGRAGRARARRAAGCRGRAATPPPLARREPGRRLGAGRRGRHRRRPPLAARRLAARRRGAAAGASGADRPAGEALARLAAVVERTRYARPGGP
jgi:hypothetical protein